GKAESDGTSPEAKSAPAAETAAADGSAPESGSGKNEENAGGSDPTAMNVTVNGELITLHGKTSYIFVDVFDYIDFDLSKPHGKMVVTKRNGMRAEYSEYLREGDRLDIYWEK
ncbi:MAG: cell division protein FtsA, partial [Lachnospiraceae bacterium]|nr:cell division protein FtsA [Lachnospiraceae bacterium]